MRSLVEEVIDSMPLDITKEALIRWRKGRRPKDDDDDGEDGGTYGGVPDVSMQPNRGGRRYSLTFSSDGEEPRMPDPPRKTNTPLD